MNKSLIKLIVVSIIIFSCNDRNDDKTCQCEAQRYERSAVRFINSDDLVSATEWVKVGGPTSAPSECYLNGQTNGFGSFNSYKIDVARYGVQEYENRVNCK